MPLRMNSLIGFGPAGIATPIVANFCAALDDSSDSDNYTFNNVNIGTPSAGRYILAAYIVAAGSSLGATPRLQLGGVNMTRLHFFDSGNDQISFHIMSKPTGTTGDFTTVAGGNNFDRCFLGVWEITGIQNPTAAYDTDGTSGAASSATLSLQCPRGSLAIAGVWSGDNNTGWGWSGLTEEAEDTADTSSKRAGWAGKVFINPATATITCTNQQNNSNITDILCGIVLR